MLALGCLSVVLALGRYGYLQRLQSFLPLVGLLREPCRYLLPFHFAMAVGAAIAFADLSEGIHYDPIRWRRLWPLALVLIPALLPFLFLFSSWTYHHPVVSKFFVHGVNPKSFGFGGLALMALAVVTVAMAARRMRSALFFVFLIALIDLGMYDMNFLGISGGRTIESIADSLPTPGKDPLQYRIQSNDAILLLKGYHLAGGYLGLPPKQALDPLNPNRLKVAGARWILGKYMRYRGGRSYGMRLPMPLPKARLVTRTFTSSDPGDDIDKIDVSTTALVDREITLESGPPGNASILIDKPGNIKIAAECATRQFLVLSESYHKGWKASVDGETVPVLPAYGDFMGCVIEPGKHIVTFSFLPKSLVFGGAISVAGIILTTLFFLVSMRRARSRNQFAYDGSEVQEETV